MLLLLLLLLLLLMLTERIDKLQMKNDDSAATVASSRLLSLGERARDTRKVHAAPTKPPAEVVKLTAHPKEFRGVLGWARG